MDRRYKTRLDVELTCYVSPSKVFARTMKAVTKNMSRTGMLMRWTDKHPAPTIGKKLTVEIDLPENSIFGSRMMQCRATVVRIDLAEGDEQSVALKIHGMRFVEITSPSGPFGLSDDLASMPVPTTRAM